VARSEIERITGNLANIQTRLIDELQPMAQLNGIIHHLQLDAHLPETLIRLGLQRHGCFVASEGYFTGDARIAHQLDAVAEAINANPWLEKLIPNQFWVGLAATVGISAFSNNNITALGVRTVAGQLPLEKMGSTISKLPGSEIYLAEAKASAVYQKPSSMAGLASRINNPSGNIRLESYQCPKGRVVVMYLPGTAEWNPLANKKAFDIRSDVELLSDGQNSNSIRAADAALSAFGATEKDRLVLVGYSQGGLVAAELAQKLPNVSGVFTMGSPIAGEAIPSSIPVVSLEHSNDVVPALSGKTNPMTENWATASRHVEVNQGETVLKAHSIREYVHTAALADSSNDPGLARMRNLLLHELKDAELDQAKEFQPLKAGA
jgi:predicted esterase